MKVLVLDGNENQAVACVRSLARAGHPVWVGSSCSWAKAGWSRFCAGSFAYPDPEEGQEAFVRSVAAEAQREPGTLVLPMTERTALPLSAERERFREVGARLVFPPHPAVVRAFDKLETTRLAQSLGITTPQTTLVADSAQARQVAETFRFPAVLKPRTSFEAVPSGRILVTGRPAYARNPEDFVAVYNELSRRCGEVLAQEFVEGTGAGYFALLREGELRAEFAHRRIRDMHPTGSGSSVRVSVSPDPNLREAGLALLRALHWHGVAMVEFRVRADGIPVFLEVNGRFWNSLPLAIYAGADFPALLASLAGHGDVKQPPAYRTGVRCRWLLGDFVHLLEVWRGAPKRYPGRFPGRLRTLFDFIVPVPGTYHDNFMLSDPLPELGDWLNFVFRKLPAAWRKSRSARKEAHAQRGYSHP